MQKARLPTLQQLATVKNLGTFTVAMKVTSILIFVFVLYYQDLSILFNDALQNEVTSYILAIPFIFTYLLYRKSKMLRATVSSEAAQQADPTRHRATLSGILICTIALILYWYGPYTFTPLEYHVTSLCLFLAGLILVMFNSKTLRVLAFPIAFLIFLTPPPLQILSEAGSILSTYASEAAYSLLKALTLPITLQNAYGTPLLVLERPDGLPFYFAIETACSGIYSLIGFGLFAIFVMYIARGANWKKAIMFVVGFSFIYALNILRIIIIVSIGYTYGTEAAMQIFHLFGGWALVFLGTLALLVLSEEIWKLQILTKRINSSCSSCNPVAKSTQPFCQTCGRLLNYGNINVSKKDLIKITSLLLGTILILTFQVPTFALTEGPAEILLQSPGTEHSTTSKIFPQIPKYDLEFMYRDTNFEQMAPRERALVYAYTPLNESQTTVWVSLETGNSSKVWHRWESSVITWPQKLGRPPLATQLDLRDIQLLQNPPLTARFFAFNQVNSSATQVVLYWFENAMFKTGNMTSEEKYVKISLITYADSSEDFHKREDELVPFGVAIASYWEPIKTWSQIALFISRNGEILTATVAAALTSSLPFYGLRRRKERKTNRESYKKLSRVNQQIIDSVHQTEATMTPTLNNITKTYENLTKENAGKEMLKKLTEIERAGIIRSDIANERDEPIRVWKTELIFPKKDSSLN